MKRTTGFAAAKAACLALAALLAPAAEAYEFVRVGDGETVVIGADVPNKEDVELWAEAGSTIVFPAASDVGTVNVYTRLILRGEGVVTLAAPDGDDSAINIHVVGGITSVDDVTLHVAAPGVAALKVGRTRGEKDASYPLADIRHVTFANPAGVFGLRESVTVRRIPETYAVNPSGDTRLALIGSNPLHLTDELVLTNFDVVALSSGCIPADCTVRVAPGRNFYAKPCTLQSTSGGVTYSNAWFWAGQQTTTGLHPIVLEGKGARVICRNNIHMRLFNVVTGVGEILIRPDSSSNVKTFYRGLTYMASPTTPMSIPVNSAAEPAAGESWKSKVAHWFDAADASSFVYYDYPGVTTNYDGHPLVIGWKDKYKGIGDVYLYNRRMYSGNPAVSQNVPQVLPYVVEEGPNGLPYLGFGQSGSRLPFHSASTECTGARAPTGGDIATFSDCTMCVMVFGSQDGGGYAILGDTNQSFARKDNKVASAWMTDAVCKLIVDGRDVVPTSERPNGGWQIVSVDLTTQAHALSCIGAKHATTGNSVNPGGQNYAELIFFREKPTPAERADCERYLAAKWGLEAGYELWDVDYAEITGNGTVSLQDDNKLDHEAEDEVKVAGTFTGTFIVPAGKTLTVSDRPRPPQPADLPQQDQITAWFDPSLDGAIDFTGEANGVGRLYSRTATGVDKSAGTYWMGRQGAMTNPTGRFPFLVETAYDGGFGIPPSIGWMDFEPDSSKSGNTLRSHPINNLDTTVTGASALPVRTVFMSLDSSAGGGNPISDTVAMTGMLKPRASWDASDPIWSPSNTVTMAHTWLGTNEVDGTATGFNGRGQVLGFELPEQKSMGLFLGFYKGGRAGAEINYEHIGETIVYKTALTEAERLTVQGYLMAKWLGDCNGTYSDLTGATVTGDGVVKSATLRNLPLLDADFTGSLAGGSALAFTIDRTVSTTAAVDALSFDRPIALDANGTVTVTGTVLPGDYTLLTAPSVTGGGLVLQMADNRFEADLAVAGTSLILRVKSVGTMVIFR